MASDESGLDTDHSGDDPTDDAFRRRVVRERMRVAASIAAERAEVAETIKSLRREIASLADERDGWKTRAEDAETENLALVSTRVFRWSRSVRSLWARIR